MNRRALLLVLAVAALWGGSYLLIKVSLDWLSPAGVAFARTAIAALVLLPVALRRGALAPLRSRLGPLVVLAVCQIAAPALLIARAEESIDSSLAGILVSSVPLFIALIALGVDADERSSGGRLLGVLVGFVGVAVLLGLDAGGGDGVLLGGAMVLLASVGYAISALLLKRRFGGVEPVGGLAGAMGIGALVLLPLALLDPTTAAPSAVPVLAVVVLGVVGSGIAFLLYYTLNAEIGPARASVVAYLAPGFSVLYGALLLDESVTVGTLAGLVLILLGSWLAANGLPRRLAALLPARA